MLMDHGLPYGISFSGNEFDSGSKEALKLLGKKGAGIPWLRVELRWDRIERSPGKLDLGYRAYVSALVFRYKDYIKTWEIWNEANLPDFWLGTPADYARLVAEARSAIKVADPYAQVMISLATSSRAPADFLPRILRDPNNPQAADSK
ncbi:MAG: hypothetical protein HY673_15810 [Chloroflexi bacterium]|nr:hypothetical protein [Chloroflexota bacterium]